MTQFSIISRNKNLKSYLNYLLLLFFISFSFGFKSDKGSVNWTSFTAGYAQAKKENKILIVDMYTDWCGWCKRMDKDTYEKKDVYNLINAKFVAVKFNPEKGETHSYNGKQLSGSELKDAITQNQFEGYPATIFINPNKNNEVRVVTGYHKPNEFIELLNTIK